MNDVSSAAQRAAYSGFWRRFAAWAIDCLVISVGSVVLRIVAPLVGIGGNTRFAGVTVETVNPAIAQELGLPFNAQGVVVRSVEQGSPADRMGLESGDVILNLNGRDMTDARTFRDTANARPDGWQIMLQRGGRTFRSFVSG